MALTCPPVSLLLPPEQARNNEFGKMAQFRKKITSGTTNNVRQKTVFLDMTISAKMWSPMYSVWVGAASTQKINATMLLAISYLLIVERVQVSRLDTQLCCPIQNKSIVWFFFFDNCIKKNRTATRCVPSQFKLASFQIHFAKRRSFSKERWLKKLKIEKNLNNQTQNNNINNINSFNTLFLLMWWWRQSNRATTDTFRRRRRASTPSLPWCSSTRCWSEWTAVHHHH